MDKVKLAVKEIIRTHGLRTSDFVRASLIPDSIFALSRQTWKLRGPVRLALSIHTCSSKLRAGSLLRFVGKRLNIEERHGIRYSDVVLWAVQGDGRINDIIAWITPRSHKVVKSIGSSSALQSNGRLDVSANLHILFGAAVNGRSSGVCLGGDSCPCVFGRSQRTETSTSQMSGYERPES